MNTLYENIALYEVGEGGVRKLTICAICGSSNIESVIELPEFPQTGIFVEASDNSEEVKIDQTLMMCPNCHHLQLATILPVAEMYGPEYAHRSSRAPLSEGASNFFVDYLESVAPSRTFDCVFEIGCNDFYLLDKLSDRCRYKIGVDPIWRGVDAETSEDTRTYGMLIEEFDFDNELNEQPDLIVSSHNLEHILDPISVYQKIMDVVADDALFIIEVPDSSLMIGNHRFDQIFHQHIHYFTLNTILKFVERVGGNFISHTINYDHWGGSLLFSFSKKSESDTSKRPYSVALSSNFILDNYEMFKDKMNRLKKMIADTEGLIWGYGAGQMVPSFAYHIGSDLSFLKGILDDNPVRASLKYPGLSPEISPGRDADISNETVLITALDSTEGIKRRLESIGQNRIISPVDLD